MREHPELFLAEKTRGWQFVQLTAQLAPPPSPARAEEEKILLLVSRAPDQDRPDTVQQSGPALQIKYYQDSQYPVYIYNTVCTCKYMYSTLVLYTLCIMRDVSLSPIVLTCQLFLSIPFLCKLLTSQEMEPDPANRRPCGPGPSITAH
jgi:hypothetical protein